MMEARDGEGEDGQLSDGIGIRTKEADERVSLPTRTNEVEGKMGSTSAKLDEDLVFLGRPRASEQSGGKDKGCSPAARPSHIELLQ